MASREPLPVGTPDAGSSLHWHGSRHGQGQLTADVSFKNMKTSPRIDYFARIALLLLMSISIVKAASITVTVAYKEEEQQYSVSCIKGTEVLLPIVTTQALLLRADWTQAAEQGTKQFHIGLEDPAIAMSGTAGTNSSGNSGPLTIFSITLPFEPGKKQLVYKTPDYSIWFQLDDDKK